MRRYPSTLRARCTLVAILTFLAAASGHAAEIDTTARTILLKTTGSWVPGDRIRVTSPEPHRVRWTGWFASVESDSVLKMWVSRGYERDSVSVMWGRSPGLDSVSVGLHQIGTLEQKIGTKRHGRMGAGLGCVAGILFGAMIAASENDPEVPIDGLATIRLRGMRQMYVLMGGVSGLVLGGVIGYTIESDRWGVVARFD